MLIKSNDGRDNFIMYFLFLTGMYSCFDINFFLLFTKIAEPKFSGVTSTGRAKTGRRNLDARQLDACDSWTRATIGRWTHAACFEIISQYLK
jgi:hypothetical protein